MKNINDDIKKKKIGDIIKKIREAKNITRDTIASEFGLGSVSAYSKIERGEIDLTISRIDKICEILQVDRSQILDSDVSQIFNVSNNKLVKGVVNNAENVYHGDEYKEKYIKMLEEENERLKEVTKK